MKLIYSGSSYDIIPMDMCSLKIDLYFFMQIYCLMIIAVCPLRLL